MKEETRPSIRKPRAVYLLELLELVDVTALTLRRPSPGFDGTLRLSISDGLKVLETAKSLSKNGSGVRNITFKTKQGCRVMPASPSDWMKCSY
jgi:hypothetical protein